MPKNTQPASNDAPVVNQRSAFYSLIAIGESYKSLLLGIGVVFLAAIFFLIYIQHKNLFPSHPLRKEVSSTRTVAPASPTGMKILPKFHIVQKGENLWIIAQKEYGSGFKWVEIAKANDLLNPGMVYSENKLVLPTLAPTPRIAEVSNTDQAAQSVIEHNNSSIITSTYTVQKGDNLWMIAVRAYGDGYQWTKIAQVNNLVNPSVIHSGNVLAIPRANNSP